MAPLAPKDSSFSVTFFSNFNFPFFMFDSIVYTYSFTVFHLFMESVLPCFTSFTHQHLKNIDCKYTRVNGCHRQVLRLKLLGIY